MTISIDDLREALQDEAIACFPDFTNAVRSVLDEIERLRAINANLMGDDEAVPRYTTKRLHQEVARARRQAFIEAAELIEAHHTLLLEYGMKENRDGLAYAAAIRKLAEDRDDG